MSTYEVFRKEAPDVAEAFGKLIELLKASEGLDAKTKQLIYIGIKSSNGDAQAVKMHVPMAKMLGATREEVKGAILITLTVSGLRGVSSCLQIALDAYDEADNK